MTGFVLDCSVAVSWCFADEAAPETDALLQRVRDQAASVPALWHLEIGNVLLQAERRGRISIAAAASRLELLGTLPIVTDDELPSRALRDVVALARAQNLTTYDASYLELAMRRVLSLATKDRRLRQAAKRVGVDVLPK